MKVKYFFAGVMALGLLASCVKEDTNDGGKGPGEGALEAEATVTIKLYGQGGARPAAAAANTRAAENTQTDEAQVNNLSLLVFDHNGTLEDVYPFTATGTQKIKTTAGLKSFVAVANNPAENENGHISWKINETKLADFQKEVIISAAEGETAPKLSIKDNGFLMLNETAVEETMLPVMQPGDENKVELMITRLAAKAQLKWQNPLVSPAFTPQAPNNEKITFDPGTFQLANLMQKMQLTTPTEAFKKDDEGEGLLLPWKAEYGTTATNWLVAEQGDVFTGTTDKSGYAPENIMFNDQPKMNEVTCMLVKTVLKLDDVPQENLYVVAKFDNNTNLTYKHLEEYISLHIDEDEADKKVGELGRDNHRVLTYPGGVMYYRVNLADWQKNDDDIDLQKSMSVKRNNFYQVSVTNILQVGWPNPDDLVDPDNDLPVVDPRLDLDATISIQPWTVIDQGADLG